MRASVLTTILNLTFILLAGCEAGGKGQILDNPGDDPSRKTDPTQTTSAPAYLWAHVFQLSWAKNELARLTSPETETACLEKSLSLDKDGIWVLDRNWNCSPVAGARFGRIGREQVRFDLRENSEPGRALPSQVRRIDLSGNATGYIIKNANNGFDRIEYLNEGWTLTPNSEGFLFQGSTLIRWYQRKSGQETLEQLFRLHFNAQLNVEGNSWSQARFQNVRGIVDFESYTIRGNERQGNYIEQSEWLWSTPLEFAGCARPLGEGRANLKSSRDKVSQNLQFVSSNEGLLESLSSRGVVRAQCGSGDTSLEGLLFLALGSF